MITSFIYALFYTYGTPSLCMVLCLVLVARQPQTASREEMCRHMPNMGEKAVRTTTEGRPGAVGAEGRERSLLCGESGKALGNRWLLSWASEKWIGFQQVEVRLGHTAVLVGLAGGCVLKIWFNHLTSPKPQPKWCDKGRPLLKASCELAAPVLCIQPRVHPRI